MKNCPDFLLTLDSYDILANYSMTNSSYSQTYLPLIKQTDIFLKKSDEIFENLSKSLEVPCSFITAQLQKIVKVFQSQKKMDFPINLSKLCENWKNSKNFCEKLRKLKRKSNSNETKSIENEGPHYVSIDSDDEDFPTDQEPSVIFLSESSINIFFHYF